MNLLMSLPKLEDLGLVRAMATTVHKKPEDPLETLNNLTLDSPALQSNFVNAYGPCVVTCRKRKGGKIAVKGCAHACVGMGSHPAELVHQGEAAQGDTISDMNMTCQRCVVCKNNVAADFAVIREKLNVLIKETVGIAKESKAEQLVCFSMDFYRPKA